MRRRKEVALGRLSSLTVILLIFGTWGAATEGASPDDASSPSTSAVRKPAPVPPIRYLEAGSRLFNSGNFDLAAKYLDAAQMYRDQLQPDEQTKLDAYLTEMAKVRASTSVASPATGTVAPATPAAVTPAAPAATRAIPPGDPARGGAGDWRLPRTSSSMPSGYCTKPGNRSCEATLTRPKRRSPRPRQSTSSGAFLMIRPPRCRTDLNKERPKLIPGTSKPVPTLPHNRENALAMLRQARTALANHQIEQAETIAQEVKGWNLSYSLFGENPDKVAAAARSSTQA